MRCYQFVRNLSNQFHFHTSFGSVHEQKPVRVNIAQHRRENKSTIELPHVHFFQVAIFEKCATRLFIARI